MKAFWKKRTLEFLFDAGTSRGVMKVHHVWYVVVETKGKVVAIGECAPLPGLSTDVPSALEPLMDRTCIDFNQGKEVGTIFNSIPFAMAAVRMAWEMVERQLILKNGPTATFDSSLAIQGGSIPINGLVWMGDEVFMRSQIEEKLAKGFRVIKLKIGALDWKKECAILEHLRSSFGPDEIELRVDANGAFSYTEALEKLNVLHEFGVHSIEQPIARGQWAMMRRLVEKSLVPIALDEELIGVEGTEAKRKLLEAIAPPYIILKPTLLGGFRATQEWIELADSLKVDWWATSALESSIGLNAIGQFVSKYAPLRLPQGLGTGQLYANNISAPISIQNGCYQYDPKGAWDLSFFAENQ